MPAQLQRSLDRLTGAVKQFSVAQRTLAVIGVAVLVLGAVFLSSWLTRPSMSPLFTSLSGADASAVVDELDSQGVAYQLADGGSTVLVPAKDLYAQRIHLAAAGIPANADGAGYSLLDDMPMTSSEFQQQKTYQRALEGELAKTIGAIDGVEAATVKLAIPEDTVFVDSKQDPTASVFVRTRAGATLSVDQVQSIVHLVSAGIPDMQPTDVAVVDASGKVLSAVGTGTTGSSSGQQDDYEQRVSASVQSLLDRVVGPGKSAVTVTADLNFDESQRTTEKFDSTPKTQPLASSTKKESYSGTGGSAAGVLGPDQEVTGTTSGTDGSGDYSSTTEDVTNAVNKTTEVVKAAPGAVTRQSVAVIVDAKAAAPLDMEELQATIAAAAGIDTKRGDTLAVQAAQFDTTQADAAAQALADADAAAAADKQSAFVRQAATIGGAVLLAIIVLIWLGRRSRRARREAVDLGELSVLRPPESDLPGLDGPDADDVPVLPPAPRPIEPDPVALKRAEISALADEQPDEVADLLRSWLTPTGGRAS